MKTVLITGCSSGFGLETAKYFLEQDWRVVATMREPNYDLLPKSKCLTIFPLDVTHEESIRDVIWNAGPVDALVNNAGIGLLNALEGVSMDVISKVFQTNTLGTIAMTQAVLPQFRKKRAGVIVNVTSTVTLKSLPLLAVYTASKAAVNAFTESLALELEPHNIRVRNVLPGRSPETKFGENARVHMAKFPEAYQAMVNKVFEGWAQSTEPVTYARDVAEAVYKAVTDPSMPMKIPAGADALLWANAAH